MSPTRTHKRCSSLIIGVLVFLFANAHTVLAATGKQLYCDCTVRVGFADQKDMVASQEDHLFIQDSPRLINPRTGTNIFTFPQDGLIPTTIGFNDGDSFSPYKYANDVFNKIVAQGSVPYNNAGNYFTNPNDINSTPLYPFQLKSGDEFRNFAFIVGETQDDPKINFQYNPACITDTFATGYESGGFARVGNTNTYVRYTLSCSDRYQEDVPTGDNTTPSVIGGATPVEASPSCRTGEDCVSLINPLGNTENPNPTIPIIIGSMIRVIMGIIGSITFLVFFYGGFLWLTSAGNSEKIAKGLQAMLWAGIGIIVVFSSYAILTLILNTLQASP